MQFNFLSGEIILINKPYGWTSFDVVNKLRVAIRRYLGVKRVKIGHAGTLDPLATGLLVICTGKFTKQVAGIQELEKEYSGVIRLGSTTPSFDLETEPDSFFSYNNINIQHITDAANQLTGRLLQVPPAFSAVKVNGKRAYEFARKEKQLHLPPREIQVHSFGISSYEPPDIDFNITCSKGTYIRAIAR
ncbi:MAG TPA: tRNA pseudouridine(55) synthase TruB, partial [Bacteroidales bacterium]|nr:tRNA pseudouridine(55) synthase TruB [Bacteroidales bacterium]